MTKEQRDALALLAGLRSSGMDDDPHITEDEFLLLASFVVDWREPAPKLEIAHDGYVHAPLGDFRMIVDKEDTGEDEDDDDGHFIDDPMHVTTVKPDFENLGIAPEELHRAGNAEPNKSNALDMFTKERPLRVTREYHIVPECTEEILRDIQNNGIFKSYTTNGKEIKAFIDPNGSYTITNWWDVEYCEAPNGSWVIFGMSYERSFPGHVLVLDDNEHEAMFNEGRAVRVATPKP